MTKHKHLKRLERIWVDDPVYYLTICTHDRLSLLANKSVASILIEEWTGAIERHGWVVGRYVIMPDHVHFFACPTEDARSLSDFIRFWKQWTSKRLIREQGIAGPVWQSEFFDHVLRSSESYLEKSEYVWENPVRAGLVCQAEDWPWQGEIENLLL